MSRTLKPTQTVVPRRRGPVRDEAPVPTEKTVEPPLQDPVDEPADESSDGSPVLLRLPDLAQAVMEASALPPVASNDETGNDETGNDETGNDETGTDEAGTGKPDNRRSRRRVTTRPTGIDLGEYWQTPKGKAVILGSLLALVILLFAVFNPKGNGGATPENDQEEWVDSGPEGDLPDDLQPVPAPESGYQPPDTNRNSGQGDDNLWSGARTADRRAVPIPTFRID